MADRDRRFSVAHAVLALVLLLAGGGLLVMDSYVLTAKATEELTPVEKHEYAVTLAQYCLDRGEQCEQAGPRKFRLNISIGVDEIRFTAGVSYDDQSDEVDTGIGLMIPARAKWRADKDCQGVGSKVGEDVGWRYRDRSLWADARQIFAPSIASCRSDSAFTWTLPRHDRIEGVSEHATYVRIIDPDFTNWKDEWKIKDIQTADVFVYLQDDEYSRNDSQTFPAFHESVSPFNSRWNALNVDWTYTSLTIGYSNKVLRTVEDLNQSMIFFAAGILAGSVRWRKVLRNTPP